MVTGYRMNSKVKNDLLSFLIKINCSSMQFELLRFVGRHPRAKVSFYVIARAMGTASADLGDALASLIEKDVLLAYTDDKGVTTYSLSCDEITCTYVFELANLDWNEATSLKTQLK